MMASGEPEDLDLDALRLAALATFKKRSNELEDKLSVRRGKDDEDLDQLRKVALQSKKGPDAIPEKPAQKRPQTNKSSNFFGGFYRDKAYGRNSNLIVIKTIPLEESKNKDSMPEKKTLLLKPQDRFCHLTDEDVSSSPQPQRWKATGKFSRFDSSSSDSEDSDDFDFAENRTDSQSSDENGKDTEKDENHSSSEFSEDELQICDESCDQFMDAADDSPQTESCTVVNGSATDANNIPRIEINGHCLTIDGKDNYEESHRKDSTCKDSSESEKNGSRESREKKYKSIRRNQHSRETRSNLRHTDGGLSESSKRRDASVCNSKDRQRRREKPRTSGEVRGSERQARSSRHDPKSILGNMEVDPEKLEARRRKFFDSEKALVAPKDGKISLRGIVAKSKTRTSTSKKTHSHESTKLPRTSVKSTVSVTPDFGGKENSRKSERVQTNIDDQDLRLLLRRPDAKSPTPQTEQLKPRRTKNNGRNTPVIKSVLSLVKVDGRSSAAASISSGIEHPAVQPSTEQIRTTSPEPSKSKRHKVVPDSPLRKRRTKDSRGSEKRRRVTVLDDDESQGECCERLNIIIQKDSQPAISHAKIKVPIHLRLGQQISTPSTAQSSDESTSPSRAVHLQTQTCEDTPEMGTSQVWPSDAVDAPSSSGSAESPSGQLPPSSDVSGKK